MWADGNGHVRDGTSRRCCRRWVAGGGDGRSLQLVETLRGGKDMDPVTGPGASITEAVNSAKGVIEANMPLVFGVAIAFVAWNIGRRVLGKI